MRDVWENVAIVAPDLHEVPCKATQNDLLRREAEQAVADGCVEIQLTAQDTAAYGKDTGESLADLINEITSIEGDFKVRVGMMHPQNIKNDLESIIKSFKHLRYIISFIYPCKVGIIMFYPI